MKLLTSNRRSLYYTFCMLLTGILMMNLTTLMSQDTNEALVENAEGESFVTGKIVDKNTNQSIGGVAVLLEGTDVGTITNQEGVYRLGPAAAGSYTLTLVKGGFIETNITDFVILENETVEFSFALSTRPIEMSDEVYELQDFTVSVSEANDMMANLELVMQSNSVLSVMSSEDFSKFAASDIGDAVKRVSGVSVVGGKYAVIRGLGDRYVSTTLNGLPVASPDPDRQAVQLDLFPSGLFEGLEVTKSYTPDQSANSTGGINLKIKDLPEEFYIKASVSTGYSSVATNNDSFLSNNNTSSGDRWANGAKDRQLQASAKGTYPRLPNQSRINDALASIIGLPYVTQAEYDSIEAQLVEITQAVGTNNHVSTKSPALDHGLKLSAGNSYQFGNDRSIGFTGGINYSRKARMIEDGYYFRSSNETGGANTLNPENFSNPEIATGYKRLTYDESIMKSSLSWFMGGGFNLGEDHEVRFQLMELKIGEDLNSLYSGDYYHEMSENDPSLEQMLAQSMLYTERSLNSKQATGSHFWDLSTGLLDSIQLEWGFSKELADQDEPSYMQATLRRTGNNYDLYLNPETSGTSISNPVIYKIWRKIEDQRNARKYDFTFASDQRAGFKSSLKVGYLSTSSDRNFLDEYVSLSSTNSFIGPLSDLDNLIAKSYTLAADIEMKTDSMGYYAMLEQELFEKFRVTGGARHQKDSATVQVNGDLKLRGAGTNNPLAGLPKIGGYESDQWYPALTLVYDLRDDFKVRGAFSKTIALPSPREVSPFATSSFGGSDIDVGNSILQPSQVESFDLGFNYLNDDGDFFGVTAFMKTVEGRIEKLNGLNIDNGGAIFTRSKNLNASLFSWYNNPDDASIKGIEIEGRKNFAFIDDIFRDFSIGGNYSIIKGEVKRFPIEIERKESAGRPVSYERSLTEQPESILNFDLTYDNPDKDFRISLMYYRISDTLKAVSLDDSYDRYQSAYDAIDLTLSKSFAERYKVSCAVKNLTDSVRQSYYDVEGTKLISDSEKKGRFFSISFSAEY